MSPQSNLYLSLDYRIIKPVTRASSLLQYVVVGGNNSSAIGIRKHQAGDQSCPSLTAAWTSEFPEVSSRCSKGDPFSCTDGAIPDKEPHALAR